MLCQLSYGHQAILKFYQQAPGVQSKARQTMPSEWGLCYLGTASTSIDLRHDPLADRGSGKKQTCMGKRKRYEPGTFC